MSANENVKTKYLVIGNYTITSVTAKGEVEMHSLTLDSKVFSPDEAMEALGIEYFCSNELAAMFEEATNAIGNH